MTSINLVLKQCSQLSQEELTDLATLYQQVRVFEHCEPKIYFRSIQSRQGTRVQDLLLYTDEQLIGYIGWFDFDSDIVELCAFIHPQYRRRGLFSKLFSVMKDCIDTTDFLYYEFAVNVQQKAGFDCLHHLGARAHSWERLYELPLSLDHTPVQHPISETADLNVLIAGMSHVPILASLDEACFQIDYEDCLPHHTHFIEHPERTAWILFLNDSPIGKIHVRKEEGSAVIHNFCIIPEMRGSGFGRFLMINTINTMIGEVNSIQAEVVGDNNPVAVLYQSLGFHNVQTYTTMRIEGPYE